jgi:hypothetical protein
VIGLRHPWLTIGVPSKEAPLSSGTDVLVRSRQLVQAFQSRSKHGGQGAYAKGMERLFLVSQTMQISSEHDERMEYAKSNSFILDPQDARSKHPEMMSHNRGVGFVRGNVLNCKQSRFLDRRMMTYPGDIRLASCFSGVASRNPVTSMACNASVRDLTWNLVQFAVDMERQRDLSKTRRAAMRCHNRPQ